MASLTNSVALIEAAKKGDAAQLTDLLKKGADVEHVDKVSSLFLFFAALFCLPCCLGSVRRVG